MFISISSSSFCFPPVPHALRLGSAAHAPHVPTQLGLSIVGERGRITAPEPFATPQGTPRPGAGRMCRGGANTGGIEGTAGVGE